MSAVQLTRLPGCYREQTGPPSPQPNWQWDRWKDTPLEFDSNGNPIWEAIEEPQPDPASIWTGGKLQELLYLNPAPDLEPICRKPTRHQIHEQWMSSLVE